MKRIFHSVILFTCLWSTANAQDTKACACCTENHRAFDFWLGEWDVRNEQGAVQGTNSIVSLQDGCVMQENWKGASGSNGTSYNFFDSADDTWNQVWIDNSGNVLKLKGNLNAEGAMVMSSELVQNPDGDDYFHQISWTPHEDGSVTQLWVTLNKSGEIASTLFKGRYGKK